jgi:hypothetical protein
MTFEKQLITNAYKKISDRDQEKLTSLEITDEILSAVKKYNLSESQESEIMDITVFCLLKIIPVGKLVESISKSILVDTNKATAIKNDLIEGVISKFDSYRTPSIGLMDQEVPTGNEAIVQKNIDPANIHTNIAAITSKYELSEEQAAKLEVLVSNVLAGKSEVSNFRSDLVGELGIAYDQALKISYDLNTNLFNQEKDGGSNTISNTPGATSVIPKKETISATLPNNPVITQKTPVIRTGPETDPRHLVSDHEQMEREDGPHLHSQSIMPLTEQKKTLGSIVEQKLNKITSSNNYPGKDPYREQP